MGKPQRITKLNLGPSEPITRRNTVQGATCIGDYLDPLNGQRTLVFERPEPAAKPQGARRKHRKVEPPSLPKPATGPNKLDTLAAGGDN